MEPKSTGLSTSEGKLTLIALVVGTVLEAVSGVLMSLSEGGLVDSSKGWAHGLLAVIGVVLQVFSLLGYQKSRTTLKGIAIAAAAGKLDSGPK